MAIIFRLILTFNATFLLLAVYWVKTDFIWFAQPAWWNLSDDMFRWSNYAAYMLFPFFTTMLAIVMSLMLDTNSVEAGDISEISHANNSFLPSYLGYFFVALSVGSLEVLCLVYAVLFVFTFFSQALYFNPIFLVFGYKFYDVKTASGVHVFLISRREYRDPKAIEISKAYRINNYTFMEV